MEFVKIKREELKILDSGRGFLEDFSLSGKKKILPHWPLSFSLILCLVHALPCEMFRCFEEGCKNEDKSTRSSHRMSGSVVTYCTLGLLCGLRWEASIQQHRVIVLKSIVAW